MAWCATTVQGVRKAASDYCHENCGMLCLYVNTPVSGDGHRWNMCNDSKSCTVCVTQTIVRDTR